jgi:heme/copper-type cytochrome/quinol oxidase subunit 4
MYIKNGIFLYPKKLFLNFRLRDNFFSYLRPLFDSNENKMKVTTNEYNEKRQQLLRQFMVSFLYITIVILVMYYLILWPALIGSYNYLVISLLIVMVLQLQLLFFRSLHFEPFRRLFQLYVVLSMTLLAPIALSTMLYDT